MTVHDKIWTAIRKLPRVTVDDLMVITGASNAIIRNYLSLLVRADFVKVVGTQRPASGHGVQKVYACAKNTGPLTPTQRPVLYDPNTKRLCPLKESRRKNVD